jgi:hypothetical protein
MTGTQLDLELPLVPEAVVVRATLLTMIKEGRQPSAVELVSSIEQSFGIKARWHIAPAIEELAKLADLPRIDRDYLRRHGVRPRVELP